MIKDYNKWKNIIVGMFGSNGKVTKEYLDKPAIVHVRHPDGDIDYSIFTLPFFDNDEDNTYFKQRIDELQGKGNKVIVGVHDIQETEKRLQIKRGYYGTGEAWFEIPPKNFHLIPPPFYLDWGREMLRADKRTEDGHLHGPIADRSRLKGYVPGACGVITVPDWIKNPDGQYCPACSLASFTDPCDQHIITKY